MGCPRVVVQLVNEVLRGDVDCVEDFGARDGSLLRGMLKVLLAMRVADSRLNCRTGHTEYSQRETHNLP
jgi:hypothetical protein